MVRPARCPALAQRAFCLACNRVQPLPRCLQPSCPQRSRAACVRSLWASRVRARARFRRRSSPLLGAGARHESEPAEFTSVQIEQAKGVVTKLTEPRRKTMHCAARMSLGSASGTPPLGGARLGCKHLGPRCRRTWHGLSRCGLSRCGLSRCGLSRCGLSRCGLSRCGRVRFSVRRGRTGWHAARSHGLATWHAVCGHTRHVLTRYVRTWHTRTRRGRTQRGRLGHNALGVLGLV
jgi:hypothetical protein